MGRQERETVREPSRGTEADTTAESNERKGYENEWGKGERERR